jgi:hypothetical protein
MNCVCALAGGVQRRFDLAATGRVSPVRATVAEEPAHVSPNEYPVGHCGVAERRSVLSKWPKTTIRVEGYCDERGSAEYNLALGDRRAVAVKEYLEALGVGASRIRTVSLGKETRFCQESSEDCWSKNRRGHFVIISK